MKKYIFYTLTILLCCSCSKQHFEQLSIDPNKPTSVPPSLLLTGIEATAFNAYGCPPSYIAHSLLNTSGVNADEYFTFNRGDFGNYLNLQNVEQMRVEAVSRSLPEYVAISQFFRAFYLYQLTMAFGDVPDSQALQEVNGISSPVYDSQKAVFADILNTLAAANAGLIANNSLPITGDIIYNGNVMQWRELINSFAIRVLISLSLKVSDPDLNVKQQFAKIVGDPVTYPIFQSNADDAMLTYADVANNRYPLYHSTDEQRTYLDQAFCNFLINAQDPRLFSFANITINAATAGKTATDFTAYAGADASLSFVNLQALVNAGGVSLMNSRYIFNPAPEPHVAVGYPELQFNLAEAALLGWFAGNPETYYVNGIKASMDFYSAYGGYTTSNYFTGMYANSTVKYTAANGLKDIMMQKYICFFMNSDYEAWYNLRRTGLPVLTLNGGGVQNGGVLPLRFMYPQTELNTNSGNLNAAIARQFANGGDAINGMMWALQP